MTYYTQNNIVIYFCSHQGRIQSESEGGQLIMGALLFYRISKSVLQRGCNIFKRGPPDLFQLGEGGATAPSCPLNPPLVHTMLVGPGNGVKTIPIARAVNSA